ncbi:hypothetical protein [Haloarchaeobius sp. TZWWS8]|uniref:hypothetical protein n=1 Tax=Haloarchaeobius sp. TZWWS8 TaxID=3446121 RepID=UPI003EB6F142
MPTREPDGSEDELAAVADALGMDEADMKPERNETGEDAGEGVDALLADLTGDAPGELTHPDDGSLEELDSALSELATSFDGTAEAGERSADAGGDSSTGAEGFALEEFDFGDAADSAPREMTPHEEFLALVAELGGSDAEDLDLEDLTLGSSVTVADLEATGTDGERGERDIDESGFHWGG